MGKFYSIVYVYRIGDSFTEQGIDVNGICLVGFHLFNGVVSVYLVLFQAFCYRGLYETRVVIGNEFFEPCGMVGSDGTVEHCFGTNGMRRAACHYQTGWRTIALVLVKAKVTMPQFAIGIVFLAFPEGMKAGFSPEKSLGQSGLFGEFCVEMFRDIFVGVFGLPKQLLRLLKRNQFGACVCQVTRILFECFIYDVGRLQVFRHLFEPIE